MFSYNMNCKFIFVNWRFTKCNFTLLYQVIAIFKERCRDSFFFFLPCLAVLRVYSQFCIQGLSWCCWGTTAKPRMEIKLAICLHPIQFSPALVFCLLCTSNSTWCSEIVLSDPKGPHGAKNHTRGSFMQSTHSRPFSHQTQPKTYVTDCYL